MVRLNGWQRLWLVLTVLWGGLVGSYTWIEWPQQSTSGIKTYTIRDNDIWLVLVPRSPRHPI
jgi:hypothetical protein